MINLRLNETTLNFAYKDVKKKYKKLSEYLYEFNRLLRKISDLIHEFSEEWMSFLESSRKINNNKSFFVIDDFVRGDLLSKIWLFTLKGLLMLRFSYNW